MQERMIRADSIQSQLINVFISYADEDQKLLEELIKYLTPLERDNLITLWYRGKIEPGKVRAEEIKAHLNKAQILLLLISADYMTEKYQIEMNRALSRAAEMSTRVIPILLRTVDWEHSPLNELQALPMNLKPVERWNHRDEAFVDIEKDIRRVIVELRPKSYGLSASILPQIAPFVPTAAPTIQQREGDVKEIFAQLMREDTSAIVLTGIGGIGKSTLAGLVCNYAEEQRKIDERSLRADLKLEIDDTISLREIAEVILRYLNKPVVDFEQISPRNLAFVLLNALNTAENPGLIMLDHLENVLDIQTGKFRRDRRDIEEWLKALNSQSCICKLLFTSRLFPEIDAPIAYLKEYQVKGLEVVEGIAFLKEQIKAVSNGKKAEMMPSEGELQAVVVAFDGHPLALRFLAGIFQKNQVAMRAVLANFPASYTLYKVTEQLLHDIYYQQLNEVQRKLLLAFSIYREAVPLEAIKVIMPESQVQVLDTLQVLLRLFLVQVKSDGLYGPHNLVSYYTLQQSNKEQAIQDFKRTAHMKAAQYYEQLQKKTFPSREKRRQKSDVQPLIEAVWHCCEAKQQREAFSLMSREGLFSSLKSWGYYATLRDLCLLLLPVNSWQAKSWEEAFIVYQLGQMHDRLWEKREAEVQLMRALRLYRIEVVRDLKRETFDKEFEVLHCLAEVYQGLNEEEKARKSYELALKIAKERKKASVVGRIFNDLGRLDEMFGKRPEALKHYEQALDVFTRIGDRRQGAITRCLMADAYAGLGEEEKAEQFYIEALNVYQQLNDDTGKVETLSKLGELYLEQGRGNEAQTRLNEALAILQRVADRASEAEIYANLGELYRSQGMREEAQRYYEQALEIARETGNQSLAARMLNNLGRIYDDLEKREDALKHYEAALIIFKEVGDHRREGNVLYNIGKIYSNSKKQEALRKYEEALAIFKQEGDLKGQGWVLSSMGQLLDSFSFNNRDCDSKSRAQNYLAQALHLCQMIRDSRGEGAAYHNIGALYFGVKSDVALAGLLCAEKIFERIKSLRIEETRKVMGALESTLGEKQFKALKVQVQPRAAQIVEQALREKICD